VHLENVRRLADRGMVWLLAAYVFVVPLILWPTSGDASYSKLIAAMIGICLLVGLWAIHGWLRGRWSVRIPWLLAPATFLAAAAALSAIPATVPCLVLQGVLLLLGWVALALLVGTILEDPGDVRLVLLSLVVSASVAAVLGVLQYAGIGSAGDGRGAAAMASLLGSPQALGGFLALTVFPSTLLLGRGQPRWVRRLAAALLAFLMAAAALVNSGSVFVALGAGFIGLAIGSLAIGWRTLTARGGRWRGLTLAVLLGILIAGVLLGALLPAGQGTGDDALPAPSDGGLWLTWRVAWAMIADHPVLGVGAGHFAVFAPEYEALSLSAPLSDASAMPVTSADNDALRTAGELGGLGLAAVVALCISVILFLTGRLRRQTDPGMRLDVLALLSGVVVFFALASTSSPTHVPPSSLVLVVILGIGCSPCYGEQTWRKPMLRGWTLRAAATVALAVVAVGAVLAVRDAAADGLLRRGTAELQSGRVTDAEATLSRSIEWDLCPRETWFYRATARLYSADRLLVEGEYALASAEYESARSDLAVCRTRFPQPESYLATANLGVRLEDVALLRTGVDGLLRLVLSPQLRVQALYLDALLAKREGDPARAKAVLKGAIDEFPSYVRAYIALADALRQEGSMEESRTLYEEALRLAEEKLAAAEAHLVEGAVLPTSEFSHWATQRAEALEEIEAAQQALSGYEPAPS